MDIWQKGRNENRMNQRILTRKRLYRRTLQTIITLHALSILCVTCIVSYFLVVASMMLFYRGEYTHQTVAIFGILVCLLTIVLGGISLFLFAKHIMKPIKLITNTTQEIAKGDFTIRISNPKVSRQKVPYLNEIDELMVNLDKMTSELEGMDYMRRDFISNVSHEVKTPIAVITGFTEVLMDGKLSKEEEIEYLGLLNQESIRLSHLCDNMLRISKLDHLTIVAKKDSVLIDEQIRKCIIMLSEKWSAKELEFDVDMDSISLKSNADLLMQIWLNLIENAIKYSRPKSTIRIRGYQKGASLIVKIIDEGQGISKEKLPKIFDRFYQCEESHKKLGNGLGLSIVKRIVELLDGTIEYQSMEQVGTTVTVTLNLS